MDNENFDKFIEETIFPQLEPLEKSRQEKVNIFWVVVVFIAILNIVAFIMMQSLFTIFLYYFYLCLQLV